MSCGRHLAARADDLGRQLRAVEQAKTEVEQSLEAVTTERDELREQLAATSDDLGRQLRAVEQAKTEVEQSLEAVTTGAR
ncbi:hypothetical protein TcBrA4_0135850 [Trypanosoma cruzi]|nr:hypothetical protein TcBrA4_0135850 [Trypanosoma cruzi]